MDVPAEVLEELKCGECETYLSRGPVYLQHDGAAACGRCFSPKRPATRNNQYEALAKLARFPCKNQDLGCRETVPFVDEGQDVAHEAVCEYRQYVCPVLGSSRCDWLGPRSQILQHCRAQHPDRVLDHPCRLTHDITTSSLHNYMLQAFHLLFLLHTKVCVTTSKLYHSVRLLDASDSAKNFFYKLHIQRNEEELNKKGDVAVQGCLALQEPTALALDINSLLSVLGSWDGATFTVAVERREQGEEALPVTQPQVVMETCAGCQATLSATLYRDDDGWKCPKCLPSRRTCENNTLGCTYEDFCYKSNKHECFFCQQGFECAICNTLVSRGTLSAHYIIAHSNITFKSGSAWRVTVGGWQRCLLSTPAGTAMCSYRLAKAGFDLQVALPVPSERLSDFKCVVRVKNSEMRYTHRCVPLFTYRNKFDWLLQIRKHELCAWTDELDIIVDIFKV